MLEAVGTPPFVVLGVVARGFVEGDFQQVLCTVGFVIFLQVQNFLKIFLKLRLHKYSSLK